MFKALPNVLPLSIPAQAKEINLCGDIHGQVCAVVCENDC